MPWGPGKYDDQATAAREATEAKAVVLIVIEGKEGSGFAVQSQRHIPPTVLTGILRHIARDLDAS